MRTNFPDQSKEHEPVIRAIADAVLEREREKVAFIILFGSFARGDWVYDTYHEDGILYEYASDYDLLVIMKTAKKGRHPAADHFEAELENRLDRFCAPHKAHSPTVIVESLPFVNKRLEEGQYFFSDIMKEGVVLYQAEGFELAKPRKLNKAELRRIAQAHYDQWFESGTIFLEDAKHRYELGTHNIAAFYLHQATEHLLHCAMLTLTNYKPKTHDLAKLLKRACSQSNAFLNIFNFADKWQKDCFKKLRSAYIDARYKKEFTISANELTYLIARVEMLQDVTEGVCKDWIRRLDGK